MNKPEGNYKSKDKWKGKIGPKKTNKAIFAKIKNKQRNVHRKKKLNTNRKWFCAPERDDVKR